MLDKIIIAKVIDNADFESVIAHRAFMHRVTAEGWARSEQLAAQSRLRASGETNQDYIDAIVCSYTTMDFDPS